MLSLSLSLTGGSRENWNSIRRKGGKKVHVILDPKKEQKKREKSVIRHIGCVTSRKL